MSSPGSRERCFCGRLGEQSNSDQQGGTPCLPLEALHGEVKREGKNKEIVDSDSPEEAHLARASIAVNTPCARSYTSSNFVVANAG